MLAIRLTQYIHLDGTVVLVGHWRPTPRKYFSVNNLGHGTVSEAKKTGWTGPHPAGHKKGEKELKSQEGRVAYYYAVLTDLAHYLFKQISCHIDPAPNKFIYY
jgi:hypothetical protein